MQGGLNSPDLFNMFIDELIVQMENILGEYNVLPYAADDIAAIIIENVTQAT